MRDPLALLNSKLRDRCSPEAVSDTNHVVDRHRFQKNLTSTGSDTKQCDNSSFLSGSHAPNLFHQDSRIVIRSPQRGKGDSS